MLFLSYKYYSMKKIEMKFKEFMEFVGAGSLLTSDQTGSEGDETKSLSGHSVFLPSLDMMANNGMNIPKISKKGKVKHFFLVFGKFKKACI